MEKVTIIIPTYNEKNNIRPLLERIKEVEKKVGAKYELSVLFVDDNSPDGTAHEIKKLKHDFEFDTQILERAGKLGLGTAYIDGFKKAMAAGALYLIQMDADLSHDPLVVGQMLENLEIHDFVIGSRYIKGGQLPKWTLLRKLVSWGGNFYARLILGFNIRDYTGGFNAYNKKVLESINLDEIKGNGYAFQIELKYKAKKKGFSFVEIPIHFHDRTQGKSKFSKNIFVEAFLNTLKLKFS